MTIHRTYKPMRFELQELLYELSEAQRILIRCLDGPINKKEVTG